MARTQLSPTQLNTRALFSVKQILLSMGFEVNAENDVDKLLVKEYDVHNTVWVDLYEIFSNEKLRRELKNSLYNSKYPKSKEIIDIYNYSKFVPERQRFDNTFEWYVGELMVKKFAAFSHSYGVSVKHVQRNSTGTDAGDYDSLVVLRNANLAYFECKAGSFDSASIMKCYERMLSINCEFSVLICIENVDKDKLIWESGKVKVPVTNQHSLNKFCIKGKGRDIVYEIHNCYILDMSGDFESKIRTVLRVNSAKINSIHTFMVPGEETYNMLGYEMEEIRATYY